MPQTGFGVRVPGSYFAVAGVGWSLPEGVGFHPQTVTSPCDIVVHKY